MMQPDESLSVEAANRFMSVSHTPASIISRRSLNSVKCCLLPIL